MKHFSSLILLLLFLNGCAGYSIYGDRGSVESNDSVFFEEVTNISYLSDQNANYRKTNISNADVIGKWGQPDNIKSYKYTVEYGTIESPAVYDEGERWIYKKGLSFGGFMPIVIIPIPLFWWPAGFNETYVHFNNGYVSHVTKQSNEMDL